MASPFTTFRKRQKTWLAILGVMCMIAFVFGSTQCAGPGSGTPGQRNSVVASTKYGDVREADLAYMLQARQAVNTFLHSIAYKTFIESFPNKEALTNDLQNRISDLVENQLRAEGQLLPVTETSVIDSMIMARKAEELGAVVSDAAIKDFITQRTQQKLSTQQVNEIAAGLKITQKRLFEALRTQLLADRMYGLFGRGLMAAPPAQKWDYYLRLNRRARAEVIPVAVADLIDEAPDPAEDKLREFFEKYKETTHQPGSPDPGFKQPHQVATEYLRADFDRFLAMQSVTDEEVREHYEKFKDTRYLFTEPPVEPAKTTEPKPPEAKDEAEKPDDKKPDESKPDEKKDAAADKPEKPCDDGDAQEAPPAAKSDDAQKPESKDTVKPADSKEPAAAETPAGETPPTAAADKDTPSVLDYLNQLSLPRDIRDGAKPKHNPLWRVEEQIRKELAGQRATKQIEEILQKIKPHLDVYYEDWHASQDAPPKRPDFAALAEQHGLSAHEIGLMSIYRIATETELGQGIVQFGQRRNSAPNYIEAKLKNTQLFKADVAEDLARNQYLYWKTANSPEHVPTLDEVRRQVVFTWKEIEARALAQKRADDLAAQARKHAGTLKEAFAGQEKIKVRDTIPFTWMTGGNSFMGPQEPRITSVPGVDSPGTDFMRTVFEMNEGEVGVAFNVSKSVAYVIRVRSLEPSPLVLRETFAIETPQQAQSYQQLAQEEQFESSRTWIEEIRESAGLHWKRPAHTVAMR